MQNFAFFTPCPTITGPWLPLATDAPRDYVAAQKRAIVGIEIEIAAHEGKWKVSQNRPEANRPSVAAGFSMEDGTREMAELVSAYGKLD